MAAVLDWRLPEPEPSRQRPPLPWLRGIPAAIQRRPEWADYLARRSRHITALAHYMRHHALHDATQPAWAQPGRPLSATLIGDIAVWRAANGINRHDRHPRDAHNCRLRRSNGDNTSSRASPSRATTRPASTPQGGKPQRQPSRFASTTTRTGRPTTQTSTAGRCPRAPADRAPTAANPWCGGLRPRCALFFPRGPAVRSLISPGASGLSPGPQSWRLRRSEHCRHSHPPSSVMSHAVSATDFAQPSQINSGSFTSLRCTYPSRVVNVPAGADQ